MGSRNAFHVGSLTRRRVGATEPATGSSGMLHHRTLRGASPSSTSASSTASERHAFRTHRRLSSYPEAFLAARRRAKRAEQMGGIELQPIPSATSKLRSVESDRSRPARPKGHRRISSTGAIGRHETDTEVSAQGGEQGQTVPNTQENLTVRTSEIPQSSLRPSVTFATSASPDPGTVADNDGEDEELAIHEADDDDDDYSQPHMNPLQLLNQAMEHGMRSAARQYRRRNMAASHQRSTVGEGAALPTTPGEGEGEAAAGRKVISGSRPPLSKQSTMDGGGGSGSGAPFEEDPLAYPRVSSYPFKLTHTY